ncbi:Nse4-domain-containing protein [Gonapodya prolifera JEL478]|uniref:Non-structural maintenance of chromosomes element 4 n=1 Tax=Gonapodya prolifera (strain JEL478) TaxID=1344416 RepID=A0A139AUX4_GONPJ|nr:Nse4-domain-containing protein [Gonapodya prolifera JEL478]|eukprot:KXS20531.1 Nse4-domain-containing protein [Gonapodya prolifera JEL478]
MPAGRKQKKGKDTAERSNKKTSQRDHEDEDEHGDGEEMEVDDPDVDKWPEQSAAQQREIRSMYRNMIEDLEENKDKYSKDLASYVNKVDGANEQLESVQRPQEATLDARLIVGIAKEGSRVARTWQVQGLAFDVDEFLNLVALKAGAFGDDNEESQWKSLGKLGFKFSRRCPTTDFMLGALGKPPEERIKKERKVAERQKVAQMQKPDQLTKEDTARDKNMVTNHVRSIFKQLKRAATREHRDRNDLSRFKPVCFFRFVTNPDPERGFSQTVENLFYLAFLIKEGKVGLEFDEDELPALVIIDAEEDINADDDEGNPRPGAKAGQWQHLMDWSMSMWRDVITEFDIRAPMIETRDSVMEPGPREAGSRLGKGRSGGSNSGAQVLESRTGSSRR